MALIKADRVRELTSSTGTGTISLAGADSTFRTFGSVMSVGDTCFYSLAHRSSNEWEVGLATYSATNTLTRTTVHASSNSNNAVNLTAGLKDVFLALTKTQLDSYVQTVVGIVDGGTGATTASGARTNLGLGSAAVLDAGVANGVATLDSGGAVPTSQLPSAILGAVKYQGAWNANTNTPSLTSSTGSQGHYYVVSVAGSTNLNGITDWKVGDWAIYNGSVWQKIDNTDAISSVNGQTGAVTLGYSDVGAPSVMGTNASGIWNIDIVGSANNIRSIVEVSKGGTGAIDASGARTNLGLTIGSMVQEWDPDLDAIAGIVETSGLLKKTAPNVWTLASPVVTLSGDVSGSGENSIAVTLATVPVTKGGTGATTLTGYVKASGTNAFTASSTIPGSDVSGNISGSAGNVTGTVAVANGGTGAVTASGARANLGLTIGTMVQSWDPDLEAIAGIVETSGLLKKTAPNVWTLANPVITLSGDVSGSGENSIAVTLSTVPVAKGGTGATTASGAINNLLPSQVSNSGRYLSTNGTDPSWVALNLSPSGSNTQVQYNNNGSFAGASRLVIQSNGWPSNNSNNVGFGPAVFTSLLTGINNVAIGSGTLRNLTGGESNTVIGNNSAFNLSDGSYNIVLGYGALYTATTAMSNVAIGNNAGYYTNGSSNVAIGENALYSSSGNNPANNVAIGYNALNANRKNYCTGVGYGALQANTTGDGNVGLGALAGRALTTGGYNTAVGTYSLYNNSTGLNNVTVGAYALYTNSSSTNTVAVGANAGYSSTTAGYNTILGCNAAYGLTTGSFNVFLGVSAGSTQADGSTSLTTPANSIYIGSNVRGFNNSDSNSIVIGYQAVGEGANTTVIGNSSTTYTKLQGYTKTNSVQETIFAITDGASVDINPANGGVQTWTLGGNRTPTATSFQSGQSVTLMIDDGTAYSVTWTSIGVTWIGSTSPVLATAGYTVIVLWKVGSTIYGALVGNT